MGRLILLFFIVGLHASEVVHSGVLSASWSSPPFDLSDGLEAAQAPRVAISSDGTKATAVWSRGASSSARVPQSASATISGGAAIWSTPINLSVNASPNPYPQVSLSSDGTKAIAVWSGPSRVVQASSATISGNLATWALPINLSGTLASGTPQVSFSDDGARATAVWSWWNGSNYIIQASSASIVGNLATWASPIDISALGSNAYDPDVSISDDGSNVTAVWIRSNGSNDIVQASSATIVGNVATWSTPIDLSTSGQNATLPQISLSADGNKGLTVWSLQSAGSAPTTYVAQASSAIMVGNSASWSTPVTLSGSSADRLAVRAFLSSDASKATAIFTFKDGTIRTVQSSSATIADNSAYWSAPVNLSVTGQDSAGANIGLSSDGTRATAIWLKVLGSSSVVQASSAEIIGNLASWTSPIDISTSSGSILSNTRLAVSAEGTVAAGIWQVGSPTMIKTATGLIAYPVPTPPQPIPALSEWTQMVMMIMMIATAGFYGWRIKRR
jgi:hypothetical protein